MSDPAEMPRAGETIKTQGAGVQKLITAIIPAGSSLSQIIDIGCATIRGIFMPTSWTTAGITFQASPDDGYQLFLAIPVNQSAETRISILLSE